MSFEDDSQQLIAYLKSLQMEELNEILGFVLSELRVRETGQMRQDVITHSKSLRLKSPTKWPDNQA
jgi:hypothetical protein